jgi:xanthine dehydrogenase FAD-binding subunit
MKCKNYYKPTTLKETLELAGNQSEKTIFVAGGTDVFVKARNRDWYKDYVLIDIGGIRELTHILEKEEEIEIGSMVTLSEIAESQTVKNCLPILEKSCAAVGSPQIRNRGTIGGNIANACLAGDLLPALCVLGAKIRIMNQEGERILPIEEIFKSAPACLTHEEMCVRSCYYGIPAGKKTYLKEEDLIFSIIVPKQSKEEKYYYQKVGRKEALSMSKFTLAIRLKCQKNYIEDLKISMGAAVDKVECEDDICRNYILKNLGKEEIKELSCQLAQKILSAKKVTRDIEYKAEVCERLTDRTLRMMIFGEEDGIWKEE